jgi:transcriptional regulator
MHPNPIYRGAEAATNLAYARQRGFGMLTIAGPDGPLASHIPYVLSGDGARLDAHIVRSNPIRKALEDDPVSALIAVSGPDGYISPDWYGIEDQVPTWNYVAVHLRGRLSLAPPEGLRVHLDALSAYFEKRIAGKAPWKTDKVSPDAMDRLMRMILPVTMTIEQIDGTWKFSQNKPEAARLGAANAVAAGGIGAELEALAEMMRKGA